MIQVIPQIEAFFALIWEIFIWWSTDLRTGSSDRISESVVKLGIFKVVFIIWSHDTSFCRIFSAYYYQQILVRKKHPETEN